MDGKMQKYIRGVIQCVFYAIIFGIGAHYLIQGYGGARILAYIEIVLAAFYGLVALAMLLLIGALKYAQKESKVARATVDISKDTRDANLNDTLDKSTEDKKEDI